MAEESSGINPIDFIRDNSDVIAEQVSGYGYIVVDSLYFTVLGMLVVFLLHKLALRIQNFSYTPTRRIEIKLLLARGCDMEAARARVLELVATEPRAQAIPRQEVELRDSRQQAGDLI